MLDAAIAAIAAAGAGCVTGALHVVLGPDHLAAIAPLASRGRTGAWRAGLRWGVGHSAGVLLVGAAVLFLREAIDVKTLSGWSERLVGITLIGIGLWIGQRACSRRLHLHSHHHDGTTHVHAHLHGVVDAHDPAPLALGRLAGATAVDLSTTVRGAPASAVAAPPAPSMHRHGHAAFAVGTLHGLAGSAHFVGILPMLALPTLNLRGVYFVAFCVGTVIAMTAFAAVLGGMAHWFARWGEGLYRGLLGANAIAAMGVGCWWAFGTVPG